MKNKSLLIFISLLILLSASSCGYIISGYVSEQRRRELEGGGSGEAFVPNYDTQSVVTVTGKITKVETFIGGPMSVKAVRVFLQSDERLLEAHLGPLWYIEKQLFDLEPGDVVTITGSLLDETIMVQQLEKEGDTLMLRSKQGQPKWFKWGH